MARATLENIGLDAGFRLCLPQAQKGKNEQADGVVEYVNCGDTMGICEQNNLGLGEGAVLSLGCLQMCSSAIKLKG